MALKTKAELAQIRQGALAAAQAEVDAQMGLLVRRVAILTNQLKALDSYVETLEAEVRRLTIDQPNEKPPALHVVEDTPDAV